jgi:hypothetical protein
VLNENIRRFEQSRGVVLFERLPAAWCRLPRRGICRSVNTG